MKKLEATLATVSLSLAEPGQAVSRNRAQVDFVIPDWVEWFSFWLAFFLGLFITELLTKWQSVILSLTATIDLDKWCYASLVTAGIVLCVLVKTGGGFIRL